MYQQTMLQVMFFLIDSLPVVLFPLGKMVLLSIPIALTLTTGITLCIGYTHLLKHSD
jgi:hypothetical protein